MGGGGGGGQRARVVVVSFASNRVDFLALQHEALRTNLEEEFAYLVVNDGPTAALREKIHRLCVQLAGKYLVFEIPARATHAAPYDAAIRCGETINVLLTCCQWCC